MRPPRVPLPTQRLFSTSPLLRTPATIQLHPTHLTVSRPSLPSLHITYPALRDACPSGIHPSTTQKTWATTDVPPSIRPARSELCEDGEVLRVEWDQPLRGRAEAGESTYRISDLLSTFSPSPRYPAYTPTPRPWTPTTFPSSPIPLSALQRDPEAHYRATTQLLERGLLFISGVPTSPRGDKDCAMRSVAEGLFGEVRRTFYGETWDVRALGGRSRNVAYTGLDLGYHMDLLYFASPPRFQFLHSLISLPATSSPQGHSLFLDAYHAASLLSPEAFSILSQTPIQYQYLNDGHHYVHSHPLLSLFPSPSPASPSTSPASSSGSPNLNLESINYSPPFQSPSQPDLTALPPASQQAFYAALKEWEAILAHPELTLELRLEEGMCVVFDNRRVLHARRAFDEGGEEGEVVRWLKGCYVDGDAVWDKWRVLDAQVRGAGASADVAVDPEAAVAA